MRDIVMCTFLEENSRLVSGGSETVCTDIDYKLLVLYNFADLFQAQTATLNTKEMYKIIIYHL